MNLQNRFLVLSQLKNYLNANTDTWLQTKEKAYQKNGWFTIEFIDTAVANIIHQFLDEEKLKAWAAHYHLDDNISPKKVGIVMAGNIPLVGFHDFLAVFISGHTQVIKLSSKDDVLLKHIVEKMIEWDNAVAKKIQFADLLKGCEAYIATGSNNSARYFEQYFSTYPHIIRKNKTSVAIIDGTESANELEKLSDDIHLYFGLGCRNITKFYVPPGYDFVPLLKAFDKYKYFIEHNKYKNNYDYQLSLALMNNIYYMTNGAILLIENEAVFSPISQVNYSYYNNKEEILKQLQSDENIQCIAGINNIPFGMTQKPALFNYADGLDTMEFLLTL
jgi:hypothetical protein